MPKKNNKTVNKIENLTVEIDYDKLAEAVVNAEKKANNVKSVTSNTFAALSGIIFRFAAMMGFFIFAGGVIGGIYYLVQYDWGNANVLSLILTAVFVVLSLMMVFLFSLLLWKSAKEIEGEKDRQFVVSVFSAIVSFTALIVALLALYK